MVCARSSRSSPLHAGYRTPRHIAPHYPDHYTDNTTGKLVVAKRFLSFHHGRPIRGPPTLYNATLSPQRIAYLPPKSRVLRAQESRTGRRPSFLHSRTARTHQYEHARKHHVLHRMPLRIRRKRQQLRRSQRNGLRPHAAKRHLSGCRMRSG